MARFLAYTPLATGHVFPLVPGLRTLVARGHEVHVRTAPGLVPLLQAEGLHAAAVDERLVAEQQARRGAAGGPELDIIEAQLARAPIEVEDLSSAVHELDPDAMLVDVNTYGGSVAAELSGRPWATTMPSLLPYPGEGIPPYSLGLAPRTDLVGRARDAVLWKVVERLFGKSMLPGLNELRAANGLRRYRSPFEQVLGAHRMLVLTGEPLEYARAQVPEQVHFVGAQMWDPPAEAPPWMLEDGDPWVLVTCSTDYLGDERLAATAVEALRDEPYRVLVTLADAVGADLPEADNVRVERFVPHGAVLPHCAATISTSGMGLVQKSLAAGVPVVAVPFSRDQPEVARRVVECGGGVALPAKKLTADRLRGAVSEAVAMAPGVRRIAAELDPQANAAAFADAAEQLAVLRRR